MLFISADISRSNKATSHAYTTDTIQLLFDALYYVISTRLASFKTSVLLLIEYYSDYMHARDD